MKRKVSDLFKNMCCSRCKSDFTDESVEIMREENTPGEEMIVLRLTCQNCGKSFGVAFLGLSNLEIKQDEDVALDYNNISPPISEDDVLNAHQFIKKLDENWQKFVAKLSEENDDGEENSDTDLNNESKDNK